MEILMFIFTAIGNILGFMLMAATISILVFAGGSLVYAPVFLISMYLKPLQNFKKSTLTRFLITYSIASMLIFAIIRSLTLTCRNPFEATTCSPADTPAAYHAFVYCFVASVILGHNAGMDSRKKKSAISSTQPQYIKGEDGNVYQVVQENQDIEPEDTYQKTVTLKNGSQIVQIRKK